METGDEVSARVGHGRPLKTTEPRLNRILNDRRIDAGFSSLECTFQYYLDENIEEVAGCTMSYDTMSPAVTLRPVDDVPCDSRVCHYDELDEDAKEQFPALADSETGVSSVDGNVAEGFTKCDLVKYTDYYEVSLR